MVKAIVFDLDNTLVDFMKMKQQAVEAAVDAMIDAGLALPRPEVIERIYRVYDAEGIEYQQVFDRFLEQALGRIDYRIHAAGIIGYRRAREGAMVSYPHVNITIIELLKRGLHLAVVSDAPRLPAWLRLCSLGLHNYFEVVVTLEDTGQKKPAPEPFRKALELLRAAPESSMMVGDWAERDIIGAKTLGMKTVFARYGDRFGTVHSGADWEIADIWDLVAIVDKENGAWR